MSGPAFLRRHLDAVGGRTGDVFAITGGTGSYQGAGGKLRIGDDGRTATVTLVS